MSTKKKSGIRVGWVLLPAALIVAWGGFYGGWFESAQKVELRGARVERGPLTISVLQRGNLAAKDAVTIQSELEGQTTILDLVAEGTFVKPGDWLVDLDASDLTDKKVAQDIAVQNAEAAYTKAKASYDIQESQNKSDIEAAERKLTFAQIDQRKYLEGDFEQSKKAAEEEIKLAQAELAKAKNTYDWSKNLADRGFLTKSELDRDELDYQRGQIRLEQANRELDILTRYDDPRRRTELDSNLKEAQRGLERAKLQAASRLVDFESALATSKSKLDLEKSKQAKYVDQLSKAKIYSKDSGMVVYARTEGGRMGGGDPIQKGTQVRERQEILTIPRTTGLIVEASVHESVLKRVNVGNRCKLRVDSIPEKEFDGTVQFVALLADKNSWWANPNQRLYRTEIQVTNPSPEMRPGMSCSLEIISETINDCLAVPLQAIVLDKGKTTAFVVKGKGSEQREVEIGRSNDSKVEVLKGLAVGDEVLLAPPPGFTPQGADEASGDKSAANARPDGPMNGGVPASMNGAAGGAPNGGGMNAPGMGGNGAPSAGMRGGNDAGAGAGEGMRPGGGGTRPDGAPRGDRPRRRDGAGGGMPGGGAPGGGAAREGGRPRANPEGGAPTGGGNAGGSDGGGHAESSGDHDASKEKPAGGAPSGGGSGKRD